MDRDQKRVLAPVGEHAGLGSDVACIDRRTNSVLKVFKSYGAKTLLPEFTIANGSRISDQSQKFSVDLRRRRYTNGRKYVNHVRFEIRDMRAGFNEVVRRDLEIIPLSRRQNNRQLMDVCLLSIEVTSEALAVKVRRPGFCVVSLIPFLTPFNCIWCKVVPALEHRNELEITNEESFLSLIVGTGHLEAGIGDELAFAVAVDEYDSRREAAPDHDLGKVVLEPGRGGAPD